MDKVGAINQEIDKLLYGLGQEGLLDDQFAQLMQLQVHQKTCLGLQECTCILGLPED